MFPQYAHFFILHHLNMKTPSNMIPFDFVLKINFDRDIIFKMMPQKNNEQVREIW